MAAATASAGAFSLPIDALRCENAVNAPVTLWRERCDSSDIGSWRAPLAPTRDRPPEPDHVPAVEPSVTEGASLDEILYQENRQRLCDNLKAEGVPSGSVVVLEGTSSGTRDETGEEAALL